MKKTIKLCFALFILSLAVYFFTACEAGEDMFMRWQFPTRHAEFVERYSEQMNVDSNLVFAIIKRESNFRANAVSHAGAKGLMQLMPDTAVWASEKMGFHEFSVDDIFEPAVNIRIGTWYIAHLLSLYDGNLVNALAAYNAGQGRVNEWISNPANVGEDGSLIYIPFPETRAYVRRVMETIEMYERLYN